MKKKYKDPLMKLKQICRLQKSINRGSFAKNIKSLSISNSLTTTTFLKFIFFILFLFLFISFLFFVINFDLVCIMYILYCLYRHFCIVDIIAATLLPWNFDTTPYLLFFIALSTKMFYFFVVIFSVALFFINP